MIAECETYLRQHLFRSQITIRIRKDGQRMHAQKCAIRQQCSALVMLDSFHVCPPATFCGLASAAKPLRDRFEPRPPLFLTRTYLTRPYLTTITQHKSSGRSLSRARRSFHSMLSDAKSAGVQEAQVVFVSQT